MAKYDVVLKKKFKHLEDICFQSKSPHHFFEKKLKKYFKINTFISMYIYLYFI